MACCKSCAQAAKVSGIKRRNRRARVGNFLKMKGKKDKTAMVITAAKIGGGFLAGQILEGIGPLKGKPYLSAGAKIVTGLILGSMSKQTQEIALGMAASGVVDIVQSVTNRPGTNGLGLIPYSGSGSTTLPGVGEYEYEPSKSGIMVVG